MTDLLTLAEMIMDKVSLDRAIKLAAVQAADRAGLTDKQAGAVIGRSRSGWQAKTRICTRAEEEAAEEEDRPQPGLHIAEAVALCQRSNDCTIFDLAEQELGRIAVPLPAAGEQQPSLGEALLAIQEAEGVAATQLRRPLVGATRADVQTAVLAVVRQWLALGQLVDRICGERP